MKSFSERVLTKAANAGAEYASVRVEEAEGRTIRVNHQEVSEIKDTCEAGFSVRVLLNGAWGFAAGQDTGDGGVDGVVARAVEMARAANKFCTERIILAPVPVQQGRYVTQLEKDPFEVSLDHKMGLLAAAIKAMTGKYIVRSTAFLAESRQKKFFASSEGALLEQELTECGGGIAAFASNGRELQRRTYPSSLFGDIASRGFEHVQVMDLPGQAPRIAEEAEQLLFAKPCPQKSTTVIIDPSHLVLQIHESAGHALELDRAFGYERTLAGGTFLTPDRLGNFRYGSELVNITADATIPGARGTFGWDDEGVPAQRVTLIHDGVFINYLSSRETASRIGRPSSGAARADAWNHFPLVRMTNINLEPGEWTLEQMIDDTQDGVYLESIKSWSIDSVRLNFQFGTEVGREIKNGKLGDLIKNPTYGGVTPTFWRGCDAMGDREHWRLFGFNCAKGEPLQFGIRIGHGAPPARFRNVQIGV